MNLPGIEPRSTFLQAECSTNWAIGSIMAQGNMQVRQNFLRAAEFSSAAESLLSASKIQVTCSTSRSEAIWWFYLDK